MSEPKGKRANLERVTLTQAEMKAVLCLIDKASGVADGTGALADLLWKLRAALLRNTLRRSARLRQVHAGTNQTGGGL